MKAITFNTLGSPSDVLVVSNIEQPSPGNGEVLVRVYSSAVNPSDVKKRAGPSPGLLDDGFIVPHSDGAGVIEAVGFGVSASRVGERVWLYQCQYGRRFGTAAEYISIPSNRAVTLPAAASFDEGACMGIPAMTAHRCVFSDGPVIGKTLLVTGGAGRVGNYAIQWAKQAGAQVIATAGSLKAQEDSWAAGADEVCTYSGPDLSQAVLRMTSGKGVDRVIDGEFGENLQGVLDLIGVGGVIATYGSMQVPEPSLPFRKMMFLDLTLRLILVYAMPEKAKQEAVRDISSSLDGCLLKHRITHRLSLDAVATAHELVEKGGFYGAIILEV
jgi:NADPH:quinone reductase